MKWPWIWIDRYALYDLHKEKSLRSLFADDEDVHSVVKELGKDTTSFYMKFDSIHEGTQRGTYSASMKWPSKFIEDDCVSGECTLPIGNAKDTLIAIHGWRMDGLDRIKGVFEDVCRDAHVNLYMPHLPFHLSRKPKSSGYSGELLVSADVTQTIIGLNQTISEIKKVIDHVRAIHGGRVMLAGISFGGYIANLVASRYEVDGLFSVFFPDNLAHSIWNTIPGKYIKADLASHGYTFEKLNQAWDSVRPSAVMPKLSAERIVLVQATYDQYIDFDNASMLWECWGKPERIVMNVSHAAIVLKRKQLADEARKFIQKIQHLR